MTSIPQTSRAAVFRGSSQPIDITDYPIPELLAGEVLVRVRMSSICSSDLHTLSGRRIEPTPTILGHEAIGEIAGLPFSDSPTHKWQVGDRVVWSICASCGQCRRCHRNLPQKCESLIKYGHTQAMGRRTLSGGFAQYMLLAPGSHICLVPPELPDEVGCVANCAAATVTSALHSCRHTEGSRVLILGAGLLGLLGAAFLSIRGASLIHVVDTDSQRLENALQFGASDASLFTDAADKLKNSYDIVLEFSGQPAAVGLALRAADVGADVALVGAVSPTPDVPFNPESIVRRCLTIHGIHNYAPVDLQNAIHLLAQVHQRFPLQDLLCNAFPLERINQAFRFAHENRPLRVLIRP